MTDTSAPDPSGGSPAVPATTGENTPSPQFPPGSSGRRDLLVAAIFVVILVLAILIAMIGGLRHWFALHTGIVHGGPDPYYNFWSGFGSDLGEATLITAVFLGVYTGLRRMNCHSKGCWRMGHHPLQGTPYILCRHHHPDVPNGGASHEHILAAHEKFKAEEAARQNS
jgi:hypothetical protein